MNYMRTNGIPHRDDKNIISCFEKEYDCDGVRYMDVYIAVSE